MNGPEDLDIFADRPQVIHFAMPFLIHFVGAEIAVDKGHDFKSKSPERVHQILAFTVQLLEIEQQFGSTRMSPETPL